MAEDRLSWSELRRLLAERTNMSDKEVSAFMSGLQSQLVEALKQDKQVRINGLGTFRLQPVAARKSVDVSTGEEITIEGYNKIIFAPEAGLRELVEKVAEVSSAPKEIDPIQKLGAQAEEIKDILGELGQPVVGEEPEADEPETTENTETTQTTQTTIISQTTIINNMEKETTIQEEPRYVSDPEPTYVSEPAYVPEPAHDEPEDSEPEESHWLRNTLIILLLLLLIAAVCLYFFLPRPMLQDWKDKAVSLWPWPAETEQPAVVEDENAIDADILAEFEAISADDDGEELFEEIKYDKLITTEKMHKDSRLIWMAYRFYGDKAYWPYLYDANKDRIDDPNVVEEGTPIRVPKLTAEQRDLNNPKTRAHLDYLKRRAERKMK